MRTALLAAATLVTLAIVAPGQAHAQPALTPPSATPYTFGPQAEPGQAQIADPKSESTATMLAVGATLGGLALTAAGVEHGSGGVALGGVALMLVGPSAGHFYAGETSHAAKMSLLRTGGLLVLSVGVISMSTTASCDVAPGGYGGCSTRDDRSKGEMMLWVGGATLIGATVYDLWDAHNAAHRSNVKQARQLTFAPSIMASASGATAPAVTVGGTW